MSISTAIQSLGGDLNITNLKVDKHSDLRGRPAVKVEFEYDTYEGRKNFEATLTNDLKLSDSKVAHLIIVAARNRAGQEWLDWEKE